MQRPAPGTDPEAGTTVFVPSLSFPTSELSKIKGVVHYEARMLYAILGLAEPTRRLVFVTSVPVDDAVVDYYLGFTPDPDSARDRLHLVHVDDDDPSPLVDKLLASPDTIDRLRRAIDGDDTATMQAFIVKEAEERLAEALDIPLFGPTAAHAAHGLKTGARRVAKAAGVEVCDGEEGLTSLTEVETVVRRLARDHKAVVIKLNDGFSGIGNAMITSAELCDRLVDTPTTFGAESETWDTYAHKIAVDGAIVEALVTDPATVSPSAQVRIAPDGSVTLLSTHDQVLGGPGGHVYQGCRFPCDAAYRDEVAAKALAMAAVLAADGVMGSFGFDFIVPPGGAVTCVETNLRLGGTTHPYWMARLAGAATFDADAGVLRAPDGSPRTYVASDNMGSPSLVGVEPTRVIEAVADAGLAFDAERGTGVTLHLLGALARFGKVGAVAVAPDLEAAQADYDAVEGVLASLGG